MLLSFMVKLLNPRISFSKPTHAYMFVWNIKYIKQCPLASGSFPDLEWFLQTLQSLGLWVIILITDFSICSLYLHTLKFIPIYFFAREASLAQHRWLPQLVFLTNAPELNMSCDCAQLRRSNHIANDPPHKVRGCCQAPVSLLTVNRQIFLHKLMITRAFLHTPPELSGVNYW